MSVEREDGIRIRTVRQVAFQERRTSCFVEYSVSFVRPGLHHAIIVRQDRSDSINSKCSRHRTGVWLRLGIRCSFLLEQLDNSHVPSVPCGSYITWTTGSTRLVGEAANGYPCSGVCLP